MPDPRTVALVTLGCARNEVDSEELAARLESDGFRLVDDAADADVTVVNTCGFVDAAKKDSIDTVLAAADASPDGTSAEGRGGDDEADGQPGGRRRAVVAVGCLAERYGRELADALPEADAVLGFDAYARIGDHVRAVLAGERPTAHTPRDRRALLPLTPVERPTAAAGVSTPGHGTASSAAAATTVPAPAGPVAPWTTRSAQSAGPVRRRLTRGPVAPLKLASGCDRRCAFCAIPSFRGSFLSRPPADVLAEAAWLAASGVREVMLVSENSTSYGKDLGNLRLLEELLPRLAAVDGLERVRLSYLQPAEMRPSLIEVMTGTPGVVPYFDLSFQHSSGSVLRRMRRFGDTDRFLDLIRGIRELAPTAGIRSNVIVGFPGETEDDVAELERFLSAAGLDAVGVFGYSDEEGTEAADYSAKVSSDVIGERVRRLSTLVEELIAQRAEDRLGERVDVLVESVASDGSAEGRSAHQAPETDGATLLTAPEPGAAPLRVGTIVPAVVVGTEGVDLLARPDDRSPAAAAAGAGPAADRCP